MNFEVVKRVRDAVSVPLVLHGASGISDADIKTAISLGIAKINIHTELCQAAMVAVKENQDQPFLHLEREVRKAVKERALGNDSNLLIVFYVQIMPDDFVMQLHRF